MLLENPKGFIMNYDSTIANLAKSIENQLKDINFSETGVVIATTFTVQALIDSEFERDLAEKITANMKIEISPEIEMTDSIKDSFKSIAKSYALVLSNLRDSLNDNSIKNTDLFLIKFAKQFSINAG